MAPATIKVLGTFVAWGMLSTEPIESVKTYQHGDTLDVPGSPKAIFTPGHTYGHCSLHLPDKAALIAGDALVVTDPYTQKPGPRIVARAATADVACNRESLQRLKGIKAQYVLTGHGPIWTEGLDLAVRKALDTPVM